MNGRQRHGAGQQQRDNFIFMSKDQNQKGKGRSFVQINREASSVPLLHTCTNTCPDGECVMHAKACDGVCEQQYTSLSKAHRISSCAPSGRNSLSSSGRCSGRDTENDALTLCTEQCCIQESLGCRGPRRVGVLVSL